MALNITTLATRWGDIYGGINEANTFAGTTVVGRANNISADYLTVAAQGEVIDDLYNQSINVRTDLSDWVSYLSGLVSTTLQTMCRDDSARPRTDDLTGWFDKLNRDMQGGTETFSRPQPAIAVAVPAIPGTNVGTGYLIASVIDPVDGLVSYYSYAEVLRIDCTADSYSGGTSAGAEEFTVSGETAVAKTAYDWPKGSGANATLTAVNTDTDAVLTDGALELWTLVSGSNYRPTDWTLFGSTTSGTHINRDASVVYGDGGTYSCKFTGDGTTVVGIYQALDQTVVKSNTNYAVSFWYRTTSATYTAKLRVALVDGSGAVITDNASTNQSDSTVDETALGAANGTWTRAGIVLRTPRSLPSTLALEFRFPAGDELDNAKSVYLDHVVMSEMTRVYDGGPYMAAHAAAVPFAVGDAFTGTVSITYYNSGTATTSFVRQLDRTFDLAANGIRLQTKIYSSTPSQIDGVGGGSLIV